VLFSVFVRGWTKFETLHRVAGTMAGIHRFRVAKRIDQMRLLPSQVQLHAEKTALRSTSMATFLD
jgi:hypothetical protein